MSGNIPLTTINSGDANWAQEINANFQTIIAHNHSSVMGSGQIIPLSAVSCTTIINGNNFSLNSVSYINFNNLATDVVERNTLYVKNNELYYANGTRFGVQITLNGAVNVKIVGGGGFSGNPSLAGASVTYTSATDTYQFLGNGGSPTSLTVFNVFTNTATIGNVSSLGILTFNNLIITNIAFAVPGVYLLFEPSTYNPQLTPISLSTFATTATSAQNSILQSNFTQTLIETNYETDIFCVQFSIHIVTDILSADSLFFISRPGPFTSNLNQYELFFCVPNKKGANFIFSMYDRDGNNLPVICHLFGATLKFTFSNSYNKALFTPLHITNQVLG